MKLSNHFLAPVSVVTLSSKGTENVVLIERYFQRPSAPPPSSSASSSPTSARVLSFHPCGSNSLESTLSQSAHSTAAPSDLAGGMPRPGPLHGGGILPCRPSSSRCGHRNLRRIAP